jgi:hypothetical protein
MRTGRRDLLGYFELLTELQHLLARDGSLEKREDLLLLVGDVIAAELHELLQGLVIVGRARLTVLEPLQELLAFLLLLDRPVRQRITVFDGFSYRGPEELFLDRFMLRLRDDQVGHHRGQAAARGTGSLRCTVEHLQHAQHALVVLP